MKALAMGIDQVGLHEQAEAVYKYAPEKAMLLSTSSAPYQTLATWKTVCKLEAPEETERRNQAVAAVYGPESVQMACRYNYVGRTLGYADRDNEALPYHRKALFLFEQNGCTEATIRPLDNLTMDPDSITAQLYFWTAIKDCKIWMICMSMSMISVVWPPQQNGYSARTWSTNLAKEATEFGTNKISFATES